MPLTRAYPLPNKWDVYISLNPIKRAVPFPLPKARSVNSNAGTM